MDFRQWLSGLVNRPAALGQTSQGTLQHPIIRQAFGLFAGGVVGVQLLMLGLVTLARSSHGALIAADLFLSFIVPGVALGWPLLQALLVWWGLKFLGWGFIRGSRVFLTANLVVAVGGALSTCLVLAVWPREVAEAAATHGDEVRVKRYTASAGIIAERSFRLPAPGEAVAVSLPPRLLSITLSGMRAGALRYGVRPSDHVREPMSMRGLWLSAEEQALLANTSATESVTALLSTVLVGTTRASRYVASAPFPRELVLLGVEAGEPAVALAKNFSLLRDGLLYDGHPPPERGQVVTLVVEGLKPSVFGVLALWFLSAASVAAIWALWAFSRQDQKRSAAAPPAKPPSQS